MFKNNYYFIIIILINKNIFLIPMRQGLENYFGFFPNPPSLLREANLRLDSKWEYISDKGFDPRLVHRLSFEMVDVDGIDRISIDPVSLKKDDFQFYQENKDSLRLFVYLQPAFCYQLIPPKFEETPMDNSFSAYEPPIKLQEPIAPENLPTSMKGTRHYILSDFSETGEGGFLVLTEDMDSKTIYLKNTDKLEGKLFCPQSIWTTVDKEQKDNIVECLGNEFKDQRLKVGSPVYGKISLFINHKDYAPGQNR